MQDRLQVGVISSTHGIAGEVKVYPTTDDIRRFKKLKHVILDTGKGERELTVVQARFSKQMVILKFAEFSNINEVEPFRGKSLYVSREDAVPLGKDEYFIADLIGMRVVTTDEEVLGTLVDVMSTGANDVYVVRDTDGKEVLLPAIRDCIRRIDTDHGLITAHAMPGLFD